METLLIVSPEFDPDQVEKWAQNLIGNHVPNYEGYIADKIVQFQIVEHRHDYYDTVILYVLVEVHSVN